MMIFCSFASKDLMLVFGHQEPSTLQLLTNLSFSFSCFSTFGIAPSGRTIVFWKF